MYVRGSMIGWCLAVLHVLCLPVAAPGARIVVSPCGNDDWSGLTDGCSDTRIGPKRTIQAAIDAADNGDEILVTPGTYNETIDSLGRAITLRSAARALASIILGIGLRSSAIVTCADSSGDIERFFFGLCVSGRLDSCSCPRRLCHWGDVFGPEV